MSRREPYWYRQARSAAVPASAPRAAELVRDTAPGGFQFVGKCRASELITVPLGILLRRVQNVAVEALQRPSRIAPAIPLHRQAPCRLADARRKLGIVKQAVQRVCECLWLVLDEEVSPGNPQSGSPPFVEPSWRKTRLR